MSAVPTKEAMIFSTTRPGVRLAPLTVALGVVACAATPKRTPNELLADSQTVARVEAALEADPKIYARHIDVSARGGVVYLSGYVWSEGDFLEAKRDAASVPGVTKVITQMELMRGGVGGSR